MEEIEVDSLINAIKSNRVEITYFYTTMCGTCQLAHRMLEIVIMAMQGLKISKCNVNYVGNYAKDWKIESVPCLVIFENGKIKEKIYAFHSVDYLYKILNPFLNEYNDIR